MESEKLGALPGMVTRAEQEGRLGGQALDAAAAAPGALQGTCHPPAPLLALVSKLSRASWVRNTLSQPHLPLQAMRWWATRCGPAG